MFKQKLDFKEFLDLSKKNFSLEVTNYAEEYPRLSDIVNEEDDNKIISKINLSRGSSLNPKIVINSQIQLFIECQRCLAKLDWSESLNIECELVNEDHSRVHNEKNINRISIDIEGISIQKIIEDEILSMIPMSIMHKTIELCENNDTLSLFLAINDKNEEVDDKKKPFLGLSKMLKKNKM